MSKTKENIAVEKHEFSAEVGKVLNIMINSLYTNQDIFLRELISNASDAIEKLRYLAQSDAALTASDLKIEISYDEKNNFVRVFDNGIGMNKSELIDNIGTIAKSGTQAFVNNLKEGKAEQIGQFGVGFYSSFMVADEVIVRTSKAGENDGWIWRSKGIGEYEILPDNQPIRGTEITLYLKEDAKKYADHNILRQIVKIYCDHIAFPINLQTPTYDEKEHEFQRINSTSALWMRPKNEITSEQYHDFYRHCSHMHDEPYLILHNHAEGIVEYSSLLYIPSSKPFDLFSQERMRRIKLYIKRVFIGENNIDIIPHWLRFMRGIVDSADLPLNISRETLQANSILARIKKSITTKILQELTRKCKNEREAYLQFWNNFGAVIKEGLCEATSEHEKILGLCLFDSSRDEKVSLEEYISRMIEGQEEIYIINSDSLEAAKKSPQIEGLLADGYEVLYLHDHVDDFWINVVREYQGKRFKPASHMSIEKEQEEQGDNDLLSALSELLKGKVAKVVATDRLRDSASCLSSMEGMLDSRLEKFLVEQKQLPAMNLRIMEVNLHHPLLKKIEAIFANDGADGIRDYSEILFSQAKLLSGESLDNPSEYVKMVNKLVVGG